jgi:hypothetical protein
MILLQEGQEIVCTLDTLVLEPTINFEDRRVTSKVWVKAMLYFKEIFEARNIDFILNPKLCVCGEGVLSKIGYEDDQTECNNCNEILPERCVVCIQDLGIQQCNCDDCMASGIYAYICRNCACQECKDSYCLDSGLGSYTCSIEGCDVSLCQDCGSECCNYCNKFFCPTHSLDWSENDYLCSDCLVLYPNVP